MQGLLDMRHHGDSFGDENKGYDLLGNLSIIMFCASSSHHYFELMELFAVMGHSGCLYNDLVLTQTDHILSVILEN